MKQIIIIVGLVVVVLGLFILEDVGSRKTVMKEDKVNEEYARGVNSALDSIMLLDLEQKLYETNRTWGAMADVVCQRLKVERKSICER
jgi:hypothetical protein